MKPLSLLFFLLLAPLFCRAASDSAILDEINLARTQPQAYANIVDGRMRALPGADERCVEEAVAFLRRQRPLEPLQTVTGLSMSARDHVTDQGATGNIGHRGSNGGTPWSRMARWGQWTGRAGENISYGYSDARTIVVTLIVDQGVPDRGHRKNIFCRDFKVAGAACGTHPVYGAMCVIDFAEGFQDKGQKVAMVATHWRDDGW
ncbi:MAG TPA: CAP domain-containing protein [Chthoniobacteraceae bacterium]|nr:CAP domain-containing protein [Chthoniobacteraceae bacterium]